VAISPGIPTSFVPRQPVPPTPVRTARAGRDYFLMGALALAGIAVLLAGGTFAYERLLDHSLETKSAQLSQATANVDQDTVQEFVRLQDRLSTGRDLLTNHIMLSQFLDSLERLTLANVRYSDMQVTVAGDHTAEVVISGTARNFNTLAAQSNSLATEKHIKRAIFSGIDVTASGLVTFKLTADIDPDLIIAGSAPLAATPQQDTSAALPPQVPQSVSSTTASSTAKVSSSTPSL